MFRYRRLARDSRGTVDPWPFEVPELRAAVPARTLPGDSWQDAAALGAAWRAATPHMLEVVLTRG